MTKHTPATPLPWHTEAMLAGQDAAYIAHAANAYPRLVKKGQALLRSIEPALTMSMAEVEFRALLREIGEEA